jgi:hypothetical protein
VAKRRWVTSAARTDVGWQVKLPRQVGDTRAFVDELFTAVESVVAGFDLAPPTHARAEGHSDLAVGLCRISLR